LAGKVSEPAEQEYFELAIRPRLGPMVSYLREVDAATKRELYGRQRVCCFRFGGRNRSGW
jgi:hypothetical protein